MNRLNWEAITLQLQNPFRVSYGVSTTRQAFWLRLAGDEGWGEGTIPPYYGVETADMIVYWQTAVSHPTPFPDDPADIPAWVGTDGPAPARCALDLALHDRIGRQQNQPLYAVLGLPRPSPKATSFTIGMAEPEEMARLAAQAASFPILKLKLGGENDEAKVEAVRRARPDAELCVDANGGWSVDEALRLVQILPSYDVTFVEQPVAKGDVAGMGRVQAYTHLPVVADESLQTLADVERLAAVGVQGVNLKLMKLGGLAPGLHVLHRAQELGMRIMLGCMVETSLGVTAMAHLSGLAEWLDLDGPLLIGNDPFSGVTFDKQARLHLPQRPGIGAILRE
ncbi:MAG: dipeptide epimerase [Ardenticatenaceae bacterium]|nr:dipeptide epimerase [Anaerolineales bacterium]MCB8922830.1 dipeptide epimerase [Ardenticatenaceae bacterium]